MNLLNSCERAAWQTVFHLHYHVIPRHDKVELRPPETYKAPAAELAEHATRLAACVSYA